MLSRRVGGCVALCGLLAGRVALTPAPVKAPCCPRVQSI